MECWVSNGNMDEAFYLPSSFPNSVDGANDGSGFAFSRHCWEGGTPSISTTTRTTQHPTTHSINATNREQNAATRPLRSIRRNVRKGEKFCV